MGCLSIIEIAIAAAKATADAAKGTYNSAIGSLRALNPGDFSTRAEFEAAKNLAISTGKAALSIYTGALGAVKAAASALSPVSGASLDDLADANSDAMIASMNASISAVFAVVQTVADKAGATIVLPPTPTVPLIGDAVNAQKALQC